MSDLICRQAAIDALKRKQDDGKGDLSRFYNTIIQHDIEAIKQLPPIQPEPHWIPVTERLPETTDAVLTTYIVNGDRSKRYVEESSYYGNDESWSSPWDEYRVAGTRIEVIAWMPLMKPWNGEVTE